MFFAIFFGIVFAALFLMALPITLPLFGIGAVKIAGATARKVVEFHDRRIEAVRIQTELDKGHNLFLWSWRKTLLSSFLIMVVGVGGILLGVLFGVIN